VSQPSSGAGCQERGLPFVSRQLCPVLGSIGILSSSASAGPGRVDCKFRKGGLCSLSGSQVRTSLGAEPQEQGTWERPMINLKEEFKVSGPVCLLVS
jgi:hypothetical protein